MKRLIIVFMTLFFLWTPSRGYTEEIVFVLCDFPPHVMQVDKEMRGIIPDIINEAFRRLGIKPVFKTVPWKRALEMTRIGVADGILAPIHTEEREKFLLYPSEAIMVEKTVVLGLKGTFLKIGKTDDLEKVEVGVVRGYAYSPEFDNNTRIKKIVCNNEDEMVKMIDAGRIPVIIGEETVLRYIGKTMNPPVEFDTVYVLTESPSYACFSRKALGEKGQELTDRFSMTLRRMKEEGVVKAIRDKY